METCMIEIFIYCKGSFAYGFKFLKIQVPVGDDRGPAVLTESEVILRNLEAETVQPPPAVV